MSEPPVVVRRLPGREPPVEVQPLDAPAPLAAPLEDPADAAAAGVEWLLLMRHAEARRDATGRLTLAGVREVAEVGSTLAEVRADLAAAGQGIRVARVHAQNTPEARATAEALCAAHNRTAARREPTLEPLPPTRADVPFVPAYADADEGRSWAAAAAGTVTARADNAGCTAALLVGHDPAISWLLAELLGRRRLRPGPPVPGLARAELIALRRHGKRWRPQWALTPSAEGTIEKLQAKIESKMNTAKAFGAVLTAVLVFVGQEFESEPAPWAWWQAGAITGFAVSIVLYLVALFFYDSLLLPRRYWGAKLSRRARPGAPPVLLRPPSSAAWVLFQNMLRVWNRLFVPATFAAGIAVAATIVALVQPQGPYAWGGAIAAAAVAGVVAWWAWLSRPVLGARD